MRVTMGSQCGGGGGGGGGSARQASPYCLTLNEVQSHLDEPLLSMNLDDLLKNAFPQGNQSAPVDLHGTTSHHGSGHGIQRKTVVMRRKKTVDEVWREMQQLKKGSKERQRETVREITLEDFLVKAGGVAEGSEKRNEANACRAYAFGPDWLQQYLLMQQQAQQNMTRAYAPYRPVSQPIGIGASAAVYPDGQVNIPSPLLGAASDTLNSARKRGAAEEMVEKRVERRQKRMIKNRESAARSRARKQAYTNELENKIMLLEEENERLRRQKELASLLYRAPQPEPKHQLCRSSSAPF